jgi:hypothetical protein
MKRLLLISLLAALAPYSSAQRMGLHFGPGANFARHNVTFSRFGGYSLPFLYPLADSLYTDYLSSGYPVASQPPVIYMQAPPAADSSLAAPTRQVQPLMIELQGDRYVRVREEDALATGAETTGRESDEQSNYGLRPPAREVQPAILVFRDGHREEVSEYTIAGGTLYSRSNYYADGSWTKKIELASLNLPETVTSNHARGVPFRLPAASNEVIVGP